MGKKAPNSVLIYAARYLQQRIHDLTREVAGVQSGTDLEYVHRMRVASRRLRNGLVCFQEALPRKKAAAWLDEIRPLTRALGKARDTDVQIAVLSGLYQDGLPASYKPGYNRLLLRLKQRRTRLQGKLEKALSEMEDGKALDQMDAYFQNVTEMSAQEDDFSPGLYRQSQKAIQNAMDAFLAYEPCLKDPEAIAELHAMRMAGKNLRYTLEIFAPLYAGALDPFVNLMKEVQDQLGEIHDNDIWVSMVLKFITGEQKRIEEYFGNPGPFQRLLPGLEYLIEDRNQARNRGFDRFLLMWESLNAEAPWQTLQTLVQAPLNEMKSLEMVSDETQPEAESASELEDHQPPQTIL